MSKLDTDKREAIPSRQFAFPKERKEPLENASHVRNAIARFNQVEGVSDEERDQAWKHIQAAAKKFGVEVHEKSWREIGKKSANLLDGGSRRVSDRIEVYALYIDPPLGRAGLTEAQAVKAGHRVRIGQRPMTRVSRATEKGETAGFMKIVVDAESNAILGASILGVGGDEAIHAVIDTMAAGRTATELAQTMHIHPTVSELLPTIAGALKP